MKKWLVRNTDNALAMKLKTDTGLPMLLCSLLVGRGIYTAEQAQQYFNGTELSDPLLIADMDKAVQAIEAAVDNEIKITVYGDYDCDGVTSTVMLFTHLDAIGADVNWYIPTREEGYGLNGNAIRKLHDDGTGLIITVDNGVSAVNEAELIYELGMKLVVTDHHQLPEILPKAEAIVNPHRQDDSSPYKELAGCGVALKLIMALERDVEGVLEQYADLAAIGTIGDVVALTGENRIIVKRGLLEMQYSENSAQLWYTYTGYDTCGTDRTRTDTYLNTISAILYQILGSLACSNITYNYVNIRECSLNLMKFFNHTLRVTMSSIDNQSINTSLDQSLCTLQGIDSNAYTSSNTQTSLSILASHWLVLSLSDVLVSNQTYQVVFAIYNRKLLNLVLLQNLSSSNKVGLLMSGNKVLACHNLVNILVQMAFEAKVTIGYDTYQVVFIVNNRNTTDVVIMHHIKSIFHCATSTDSNRIVDHTILGTLYDSYLMSLFLNRHVLVDDTDTTFACDSYRHRSLSNSIHRSCDEWDIQLDVTRELGFQLYLFRQYL